jgi:hypothetical protein
MSNQVMLVQLSEKQRRISQLVSIDALLIWNALANQAGAKPLSGPRLH